MYTYIFNINKSYIDFLLIKAFLFSYNILYKVINRDQMIRLMSLKTVDQQYIYKNL